MQVSKLRAFIVVHLVEIEMVVSIALDYYVIQQLKFDPLAKSIIESMASPKCSKSTLKNMLQSYRALEYKRNPSGIITLLCALNECKDI